MEDRDRLYQLALGSVGANVNDKSSGVIQYLGLV